MDPITIVALISSSATIAKVLFQGAESLYKFTEKTKNADKSLRSLHREATALGRTLGAVGAAIEQPEIKDRRTILEEYSMLWASLDESIRDCEEAGTELQQCVQKLQSGGLGTLSQAWRAFRSSLKQEDIDSLRAEIVSHHLGLQVCLQAINLVVSVMSPDQVVEKISPKFDILSEMIDNLRLDMNPGNGTAVHSIPRRRARELVASAEVVLSNASVIMESRSTVSGSITDTRSTVVGSVNPLSRRRQSQINDWIKPYSEQSEQHASSSSDNHEDLHPTVKSEDEEPPDNWKVNVLKPEIESIKQDHEIEVLNRTLDRGRKEYYSEKYSKAIKTFEQAIESIEKLPLSQQRRLDIAGHLQMLADAMYWNTQSSILSGRLGQILGKGNPSPASALELRTAYKFAQFALRREPQSPENLWLDIQMSMDICQTGIHVIGCPGNYELCLEVLNTVIAEYGKDSKVFLNAISVVREACYSLDKMGEYTTYQEILQEWLKKNHITLDRVVKDVEKEKGRRLTKRRERIKLEGSGQSRRYLSHTSNTQLGS